MTTSAPTKPTTPLQHHRHRNASLVGIATLTPPCQNCGVRELGHALVDGDQRHKARMTACLSTPTQRWHGEGRRVGFMPTKTKFKVARDDRIQSKASIVGRRR